MRLGCEEGDRRTHGHTHERTNGHREPCRRPASCIELRIPKLRRGSSFPSNLGTPTAHRPALYAVVMTAYVQDVSTRSVDDLVAALGMTPGSRRPRCPGSANASTRISTRSAIVRSATPLCRTGRLAHRCWSEGVLSGRGNAAGTLREHPTRIRRSVAVLNDWFRGSPRDVHADRPNRAGLSDAAERSACRNG